MNKASKAALVGGLVFVSAVTAVWQSGTVVGTERGMGGRALGHRFHWVDESPAPRDAQVVATIDGVASTFGLTMPVEYGVPGLAKLQWVVDGDTSAVTALEFDQNAVVRLTGRRITRVGASPQFMVEISGSAQFDSVATNINNGRVGTTWPLGPGSWWVRASRYDAQVEQYGRPTWAIGFVEAQPDTAPPPPPPAQLLERVWWNGAHTIYIDFTDTVATLAADDIQLFQNGQPQGSNAAPVQIDWNSWRQYRGENARIAGTHLAIVKGDSLGWVEE